MARRDRVMLFAIFLERKKNPPTFFLFRVQQQFSTSIQYSVGVHIQAKRLKSYTIMLLVIYSINQRLNGTFDADSLKMNIVFQVYYKSHLSPNKGENWLEHEHLLQFQLWTKV